MSWLRAITFLFTLLAFVLQPASASALGPAHSEARVSAFELVAMASVGASAETSPGLHEGIRHAYDENASGYRFAPRGAGAAIRYTAADAGPLSASIANTFRGGSYTATTLSESTTLYRVYGGTAGELGSFWSRTAPSGPLQATIDSALNPAWGNTAANVARIQVPAGTTIYEGAAAAQGGLVGGGSQVFIPSVNAGWLVP